MRSWHAKDMHCTVPKVSGHITPSVKGNKTSLHGIMKSIELNVSQIYKKWQWLLYLVSHANSMIMFETSYITNITFCTILLRTACNVVFAIVHELACFIHALKTNPLLICNECKCANSVRLRF